jgi:hypothetical protein
VALVRPSRRNRPDRLAIWAGRNAAYLVKYTERIGALFGSPELR